MYCSYCGAAVAQGLSYCKHCGSKSSGAKGDDLAKASEVRPEMLVNAMLMVFVFGLGAIIGQMAVMRTLPDFDFGRIMAVTLLSFLIMVGLEAVFIWLLLRRRGGVKDNDDGRSDGVAAGQHLCDRRGNPHHRAGAGSDDQPNVKHHLEYADLPHRRTSWRERHHRHFSASELCRRGRRPGFHEYQLLD